jgi:cytochrome b561
MLSSLTSKWIGRKTWRALHYLSFAAFFAILFHGINNGTETQFVWAQELYVSTGFIVVFMFLWRLLSGKNKPVARQTNTA